MTANLNFDDDEKGRPLNQPNFYLETSSMTPEVKFSSKKMKREKSSFEDQKMNGSLSVFKKFCFGVGGLPYQMTSTCIGLFIPTFLLEIGGLRPKDLSIILFYGKLWDAITDPLIGFVVSKTNTKFGKLRPWIISAAPFAVFCYMMIWFVPDFEKSNKLYWYLIFYCAFQTFLSCLHVPYTSLTMYLTHNQKERDSATGFRMGLEVFGIFLAAIIQGIMITIYGKKYSCKDLEAMENQSLSLSNSSQSAFLVPNEYSKLGEGYLISAGIMGTIYLICCFTTFFGTKEMEDVITDKDNHFISSIGSVFKHKSYITLLVAFLFNSLSGQLLQTNIALYCKHSIEAKNQYQLIIIVLLVAMILSMPVWQYLMIKYGKRFTYSIGLIMFIPNLIPLMFISNQMWLIYLVAIGSGISLASHFLLPWSMLPDVIDEFMIRTGERKETLFYSFFVFFTKFSAGISVAVSSLFLEYSGYEDCPNGCCNQPESVKLTLRMLLVPAPIILILLSLIFLYLHPINEKKRLENREILENMRKKSRDALSKLNTE